MDLPGSQHPLAQSPEPRTLTGCLAAAAQTRCGARFLGRSDRRDVFVTYEEVLDRAKRFASALLRSRRCESRLTVGLVSRTCPDFYGAFFGCMVAGAVPAILPYPRLFGGTEAYFERVSGMIHSANLNALWLGETAVQGLPGRNWLVPVLDADQSFDTSRSVETDLPAVAPSDVAFIQFSSGTTAAPKPIPLRHEQVLFNSRAIIDHLGYSVASEGGGVSWLPLHHDMGLIGCLINAVVRPIDMTYLTPEAFLIRPQRWLEAISRTGAFASPAPGFALARCLEIADSDLADNLDLSRWRFLICGADRLEAATLDAFARRFARYGFDRGAIMPAYGLAEVGLAVSMTARGTGAQAHRFLASALKSGRAVVDEDGLPLVANGVPLPGYSVRVADEADLSLPEGRCGRVLVEGGSIHPPGWLDTGDDGFVHDGALYITGRRKETIILNGENYSAQYLEQIAASGLEGTADCAAVAITDRSSGREGVALFAELRHHVRLDADVSIEKALRRNLGGGLGIVPAYVRILSPGRLPRTTSGKIMKNRLAELASDADDTRPA